ncbi:MAG: alpha/beta fold hydrolase, partial [Planctomycetota bacterium]
MKRKQHIHRCTVALLLLVAGGCAPGQDGRFPPPTINALFPPSMFGVAVYEDVTFTTSQGHIVHGWFMPVENSQGTVLINHGAVSNRSGLFGHYTLLMQLGYNVFVYDYQGFGESYTQPSLDTILPDANAALAYLQQRTDPGTDRIVLYGVSLGTLPTIAQAVESPDNVVGIVLEGSFVPEFLPPWSMLLIGIAPWANAIANLPAELEPRQHVRDITLPKMFIQSQADTVTPFSGAELLFELAAEPKQFVETSGLHAAAWQDVPAFPDTLGAFLSS